MAENKTIGENIARQRKRLGLTQEELAEKMNVSAQAVSKWENDLSYPDIETLCKLADLFECSLDELVNDQPAAPRVKSAKPEKVEKRILTIHAEEDYKSDGDKVTLRLPVALVKRAAEVKKLRELLGDKSEIVDQILPLILEGAVGELLCADDGTDRVRISVDDYES